MALDTETGEIGSAGASCINNSIIISDIIPGQGAIHTQAWYRPVNQNNAHARMIEGYSPEEIIQWLIDNDDQGTPGKRQYGIVDFDSLGNPRTAAFTGNLCDDYKGDTLGFVYAIQGNILLGRQIIDSMASRFDNTEGMLAEKLMAALQGAKVPGADTRCMVEGVSTKSAFIRMARPSDTLGTYYLDLNVPSRPYGVEPIDSLQVLFDEWLALIVGLNEGKSSVNQFRIYPNPATDHLIIDSNGPVNRLAEYSIMDLTGRSLLQEKFSGIKKKIDIVRLEEGVYFLVIKKDGQWAGTHKFVKN